MDRRSKREKISEEKTRERAAEQESLCPQSGIPCFSALMDGWNTADGRWKMEDGGWRMADEKRYGFGAGEN